MLAASWTHAVATYPGGVHNCLTVRPSQHLGLGHRRAVLMKPAGCAGRGHGHSNPQSCDLKMY
jgi:hypothetical protein